MKTINSRFLIHATTILCVGLLFGIAALFASGFPDPPDRLRKPEGTKEIAVLAGGCFWGMEAVFERLEGVTNVVSGYSGGTKETARYKKVGTGRTGHAESVRIEFNPQQISFGTLLKVFFSVAHDPTQLNRQGPDVGSQYRSEIFYDSPEQKRIAEEYIRLLNRKKVFRKPIVTRISKLTAFYPAEAYHQDFLDRNPANPYIVQWDLPKIQHLKKEFPDLIAKAN